MNMMQKRTQNVYLSLCALPNTSNGIRAPISVNFHLKESFNLTIVTKKAKKQIDIIVLSLHVLFTCGADILLTELPMYN